MATNPPVQVGELVDVPAPGSGVKSAWSQEVAARILGRFATAAARTSAWAASAVPLAKGTPSYLATGAATEGPEYFNGVSWRKPWNQSWGLLGYAKVVAIQTGFDTVIRDIGGASVVAAVAGNRLLRVSLYAYFSLTTTTSYGQFFITDGADVSFTIGACSPGTVGGSISLSTIVPTVAGTTSLTVKARVNCGAGNLNIQNPSGPLTLTVEDVGPAVGSPT